MSQLTRTYSFYDISTEGSVGNHLDPIVVKNINFRRPTQKCKE